MRGPSQLRDRADLLLYIKKKPGDIRQLTFTKVRGAKEPASVWLDATGAVTRAPESTSSLSRDNISTLRRFLEQNPDVSYSDDELASALNLQTTGGTPVKPATYRRRYLDQLVKEGVAREIPDRGQKDKKRWQWAVSNSENRSEQTRQPRHRVLDGTSRLELLGGE